MILASRIIRLTSAVVNCDIKKSKQDYPYQIINSN